MKINQIKWRICFALIVYCLFQFYSLLKSEEEAIFSIRAEKYSYESIVYLDSNKVFIPFEQTVGFLKIFYEVNDSKLFKGYVNRQDSTYYVDFSNQSYQNISKVVKQINTKDWMYVDDQIFVTTELFADVFQFRISTSFNDLMVNIASPYLLPVKRVELADYFSNNFKREIRNFEYGPLVSERKFVLINGGNIDYSLSYNGGKNSNYLSFNTNLGMLLLNGEFQYSISGSNSPEDIISNTNLRWRYILDNPYINSISFGNLSSLSMRNFSNKGYTRRAPQLYGLQLTNENQKVPLGFSDFVVDGKADPNWVIELFVDNQLFGSQKTDLTGYYNFVLPISYGQTSIYLRKCGPMGEFEDWRNTINISSELLKPGTFLYTANLGRDFTSGISSINGTITAGIFDWYTINMYAEKQEATEDFYISLNQNINLFSQTLIKLMANNLGVYQLNYRIPPSFLGSWDIVYTYYDTKNSKMNSSVLNTLQLYTSVSRIFSIPVSIYLSGYRSQFLNFSTYSVNTNLSFYLNKYSMALRHNMAIAERSGNFDKAFHNMTGELTTYFGDFSGLLSIFGNGRISFNTGLNPEDLKFYYAGLSFNKSISRNSFITFSSTYNTQQKILNSSLGLTLNLETFRSSATANYQNNDSYSASANVSGTLEFDPVELKFRLVSNMGSSNYGRSTAAIRFYIDQNGNDKYDDGIDKALLEPNFIITNEFAQIIKGKTAKYITNLLPGRRYNIQVDPSSFSNPLIIPDKYSFSFYSTPYSTTNIDIQCRLGGMIEGTIFRKTDDGKQTQNGMKVHIEGLDNDFKASITVFSDGSYFYSGLPLGNFKVYLDSIQLGVLKSYTIPEFQQITVVKKPDGDFIGHVDLTIVKIGQKKIDGVPIATGGALAGTRATREEEEYNAKTGNESTDKKPASLDVSPEEQAILNIIEKQNSEIATIETPAKSSVNIQYNKPRDVGLTKNNQSDLRQLAKQVLLNPRSRVLIESHSDNFGSISENFEITQNRADEIGKYLIKQGLRPEQIISHPKGSLSPIDNNRTEEGRKRNRRTIVKIIEK